MKQEFDAGESVEFADQIVTVRSLHIHREQSAYLCEDSTGAFFYAKPDQLRRWKVSRSNTNRTSLVHIKASA